MQLDDLLSEDVDALRQKVASHNIAATLRSTLTDLAMVDLPQSAAGAPVRVRTDRAPALPDRQSQSTGWPASEITVCREHAEKGHAPSARRLAELMELTGQNAEAHAWWQRAADLGDRDAIAYLEEISRSV